MEDFIRRLGERIRQIRIQRGFKSQEEFADYCKLHRTFIGHLETGRKDFRLSTIIRVAEMLGVTMGYLFAGIESEIRPKRKVRPMDKTDSAAMLREINLLENNILRLKERATPKTKAAKTPRGAKLVKRNAHR